MWTDTTYCHKSKYALLNETIYLMNPDGSDQRLLAGNGGRNIEPRSSLDGRFVYFTHCVHHLCETYWINAERAVMP